MFSLVHMYTEIYADYACIFFHLFNSSGKFYHPVFITQALET